MGDGRERDSHGEAGGDSGCWFIQKWVRPVKRRRRGETSWGRDEEEGVTDREAGPDLISSTGKLTVINLINVHQQFPCSRAPSRCFYTSSMWRSAGLLVHKLLCYCMSAFQQSFWEYVGTHQGLEASDVQKQKRFVILFCSSCCYCANSWPEKQLCARALLRLFPKWETHWLFKERKWQPCSQRWLLLAKINHIMGYFGSHHHALFW